MWWWWLQRYLRRSRAGLIARGWMEEALLMFAVYMTIVTPVVWILIYINNLDAKKAVAWDNSVLGNGLVLQFD